MQTYQSIQVGQFFLSYTIVFIGIQTSVEIEYVIMSLSLGGLYDFGPGLKHSIV